MGYTFNPSDEIIIYSNDFKAKVREIFTEASLPEDHNISALLDSNSAFLGGYLNRLFLNTGDKIYATLHGLWQVESIRHLQYNVAESTNKDLVGAEKI